MPKRKKQKTIEEKSAEEYFPIDKDDVKHAIEIPVKQINKSDLETVEVVGKKKTGTKFAEKTTKRKTAKNKRTKSKTTKTTKTYEPPKISLKKGGYELIITEKPQAAFKIASALGGYVKKNIQNVPYYNVSRNNHEIIVACAVGHLFTLKQKENNKTPTFNIGWVPNYMVRKNDFSKKYYDVLLKLTKNAGSLTIATDYDIEGEVIGLNVVRFICSQADANRMKFSTLTTDELNKAYEDKMNTIDWGQAIAGETRHYLDWFYGINLSRALMNAIKTSGGFKIISIGRVQGPALNLIVNKEREIKAFKPTPYWQVFITIRGIEDKNRDIELELKYIKDLTKKFELEKFKNLKGKTIQTQTKKIEQIIPPGAPFDLTTLQTEAYRFYGITPVRTLQIAQSLYLAGLISYPRTSSQKLPASIDYQKILSTIAKKYNAEKLITRSKPIEGKKSDPAHPSIYPTGQPAFTKLSTDEQKIYTLIAKRFIALFCDDAIIDNKIIRAEVDNLVFSSRGSAIRKKAWMEIYPIKMQEKDIPDLEGKVKITKTKTQEKQTQPPKRYSPASIVTELAKRNLGTKATRAAIIEILYNRGYIQEKAIQATPFGITLISSLEKYSPIIIDEALTRHFEKEMEAIQSTKKHDNKLKEKQEKVINEAKETITKIYKQFEKNQEKIGKELLKARDDLRKQEQIANTLTQCPVCKKGNLRILYNKNLKRYFVACSAYPECRTTFTLPYGLVKNTDKTCEHCGFPKLLLIKKGRRPWEFCFNPKCESWGKEKGEKKSKKIRYLNAKQ